MTLTTRFPTFSTLHTSSNKVALSSTRESARTHSAMDSFERVGHAASGVRPGFSPLSGLNTGLSHRTVEVEGNAKAAGIMIQKQVEINSASIKKVLMRKIVTSTDVDLTALCVQQKM